MAALQFPPLQSTPSTTRCTNCSALMSLYSLPGHYGRPVAIDVCHDCNAIWFDQGESTQLSPDGTVGLFQLINERGGTSTNAASKFGEGLSCVTCGAGMRLTTDRVKNTRFAYQSCPSGHGRLTTFYNFLAEKQFVRELTQAERAKLAVSVQQIKCSSCAAQVDIGKTDACAYCRAPVSVFDRDAAKKAIDHYLQARQQQIPAQAQSVGLNHGYGGSASGAGGFGYGGVDLASDILFALGHAATRGFGGARSRVVPAAVVGGASGGDAASVMPTATDALFGSALGSSSNAADAAMGGASSVLSSLGGELGGAGGALPSATDALFGATANPAYASTESAGGFFSEISNLFSGNTASGAADAVADAGGSALEGVVGSVLEGVGDVASSGGELVDLVSDGLGSLLGSLFD